jgi:hypothetical protein
MHRSLWEEKYQRERLGVDGYKWFVEKAEPHIAACPECKGSGEILVPDTLRNHGPNDTYKVCRQCTNCSIYASCLVDFVYCYFHFVPPAYRWCILSKLKPCEETSTIVSVAQQQTILDMLRAEPEESYMFFGPPHAGKTVWTTALYIQNLWLHYIRDGGNDRYTPCKGRSPIRRITAKKMLDQHTDYAMRRYEKDDDGLSVVDEPDVNAEKIVKLRHNGVRFKLYLEEIDKIAQTDARRNNLFEIINTLHEQEGVLVLNSNLRPEEFAVQFGEDFAWRIGKKCKTINLFAPDEARVLTTEER